MCFECLTVVDWGRIELADARREDDGVRHLQEAVLSL